jgi:hypothetical protein
MEICRERSNENGLFCSYAPRHAGRHSWETEEEYLARVCPDQLTTGPAPALGCTRSHPHEDMDAACKEKTVVARRTNAKASHAWRMSDSSLHDDVRCTRCGALDTDPKAYEPCAVPVASFGHQFAPGGFCTLCGCHETRSGMARQRCPGVNSNLFIGVATAATESGDHYRARGGIEPIEFIVSNSLDFLEGNVVKYVSRYRNKDGLKDLRKAMQYLQWLIEREEKVATGAK